MASSLSDSLRRSFSGVAAGCSCPLDVAESMRRVIGGDDSLCRIHDGVAIERRRLEAAADVARLRVETLRQVVARQDAADLPECSCPSVVQAVRAGFGGEVLPECALHAGPSIPAQMNIPIGDDSALIALLGQHGLLPTNDL